MSSVTLPIKSGAEARRVQVRQIRSTPLPAEGGAREGVVGAWRRASGIVSGLGLLWRLAPPFHGQIGAVADTILAKIARSVRRTPTPSPNPSLGGEGETLGPPARRRALFGRIRRRSAHIPGEKYAIRPAYFVTPPFAQSVRGSTDCTRFSACYGSVSMMQRKVLDYVTHRTGHDRFLVDPRICRHGLRLRMPRPHRRPRRLNPCGSERARSTLLSACRCQAILDVPRPCVSVGLVGLAVGG